MASKKLVIKYTKHANYKILERNIEIDYIKNTIMNPDQKTSDMFDESLEHFIKKIDDKYLRIIGKWESRETLIVISAFYDRRIKRRENK